MSIIRYLTGAKTFWYGGDSKSATPSACWQYPLITLLEGHTLQNWTYSGLATVGWTVVQLESGLAAHLAGISSTPDYCFVDIGVNDISAATLQAAFETAYASILDQLHTKWSSVPIYGNHIYRSGAFTTQINNINSWIDTVLATRAWATLAFNESDWLTGGNTTDGLHPNVTGYFEMARRYRTAIGF